MKKGVFSIFARMARMMVLCIALVILFLNVSTLWAINHIRNGGYVKAGYYSAIIGSGSMTPALSVNDLLLVKGGASHQAGDIVTYVSQQGTLVTHRIQEALGEGYIVQGDANNIPDDEISKQRILGRVVFVSQGAGDVIDAILTPSGMVLLISFFLFWRLFQRARRDQHEDDESAAGSSSGNG